MMRYTRIEIICQLKGKLGDRFIGGIRDSELARIIAPDIIVSKRLAERGRYLRMFKIAIYVLAAQDYMTVSVGKLQNMLQWEKLLSVRNCDMKFRVIFCR